MRELFYHDQLYDGFEKNGPDFEKIWKETEIGWGEYKESEDYSGECEAVFTRNLFSNLCRLEMDIICTNKRRLSSKTPHATGFGT